MRNAYYGPYHSYDQDPEEGGDDVDVETAMIAFDGQVFDLVRVGEDDDGCINDDGTCCGCRRPTGEVHDIGCDWEPCPRCGAQFIACNCTSEERPSYTFTEMEKMIWRVQLSIAEHRVRHLPRKLKGEPQP